MPRQYTHWRELVGSPGTPRTIQFRHWFGGLKNSTGNSRPTDSIPCTTSLGKRSSIDTKRPGIDGKLARIDARWISDLFSLNWDSCRKEKVSVEFPVCVSRPDRRVHRASNDSRMTKGWLAKEQKIYSVDCFSNRQS